VRRGFTLIELLTVIAIVAVLAAIIFPVFSIVRHQARRARCQSNMRQVVQALRMYADDFAGYLPSFSQSHPNWGAKPADPNNPAADVVTWDLSIQDRLRNRDILVCPDNPFGRDRRAYALTAYTQKRTPTGNWYGERVENISPQTGVVLLFEKGKNQIGSWGDAMGENFHQSHGQSTDSDYSAELFHMKGKNFGYLDGHVKWFKPDQGPFGNPPAASNPSTELGACLVPGKRSDGGEWSDAG
jgi:prepilin-type N-terminal cleavage/methylation domain-containing protein/prepilin-type processing-associated H-X9-DG protein